MSITPKTNPLMQRLGAKSRQKGYSIIELSIALAIVSIILVTALTGVQRILRTNNLNEELKKANLLVAQHESGGRTTVVHVNANGTRDIGLMQINSA